VRILIVTTLIAITAWGWSGTTFPGSTAFAAAEEDEYQGLPPGAGRDEVFGLCGACHSMKLVTQQGLSRDRWDTVLDYMVEEQEMPEVDEEMRKLLLDYLAEFYGPDRKARSMQK
jgi:cytochrome c553